MRSVGKTLIRKGAGSLIIRLANTAMGFLMAVVLARMLGISGYGAYSLVMSGIMLLSGLTHSGLTTLLVRNTSYLLERELSDELCGLWVWAFLVVIALSCVGMLGVSLLVSNISMALAGVSEHDLNLGKWLIPILSVTALFCGILRGLRHVVLGQLPEQIIKPLVMLIACAAVLNQIHSEVIDVSVGLTLNLVAALGGLIGAMLLVIVYRPGRLTFRHTQVHAASWTKAAALIGYSQVLQLSIRQMDVLILGFYSQPEVVGQYRAASTLSGLCTLGITAANMVVAPYFSSFFARNELAKLQVLVTRSARAILLLTLPVVAVFLLKGEEVLSLAFGKEFALANPSLSVLVIGQFVNASMGSVGMLLTMTKYEKEFARGLTVAFSLHLILCILLIPRLDAIGAAVATSCALIVWNLMLWRSVRTNLGIESTAFYFPKRGESD